MMTLDQQEERRLCLLIAGVYAAGDYDETAARWVDMALAVGAHNDHAHGDETPRPILCTPTYWQVRAVSRLCYCASFHDADPKPTARCRTCPAYTSAECQQTAAILKEAGYPRTPESIDRARSLIVGKHPKTEQGNVAMDADDPRWTTASNGS